MINLRRAVLRRFLNYFQRHEPTWPLVIELLGNTGGGGETLYSACRGHPRHSQVKEMHILQVQ